MENSMDVLNKALENINSDLDENEEADKETALDKEI